ncbi:RPS9 [Ecytonucleospora hepatopenaei]|uniref:RPS9 n=1 Tax=Ecytonucleospora hepatopenaei TaxID=646526 RepID=A0A1W0E4I0_9MICR|nr:RPS9 [Ecytonucleospora hepatopenaei]
MGGVIRRRKIATTPRNPWEKSRIIKELQLLGKYGLRNKKELWTILTISKKDKEQARKLLITTDKEEFMTEGRALLNKLFKLGLISGVDFNDEEDIMKCLKDVLNLELGDYLERRLQSCVARVGYGRNMNHARSLITQSQIVLDGRVVNKPGMMIRSENEGKIQINPNSALGKGKKGRFAKKSEKKEEEE